MKVVPSDRPLERITTVELTDKEIQFITRGLLNDSRDNDANGDLYGDFDNLLDELMLDPLPQ